METEENIKDLRIQFVEYFKVDTDTVALNQ